MPEASANHFLSHYIVYVTTALINLWYECYRMLKGMCLLEKCGLASLPILTSSTQGLSSTGRTRYVHSSSLTE